LDHETYDMGVDPMGLKDKYAIVGIEYTPQGCIPGRTALSFRLEACANAIAGSKVIDPEQLIRSVSEGATFKEVTGVRLLTLRKT
jgi:hypothetical protein